MATWCQEHHTTWQGDPNTKSKKCSVCKDEKEIEKGKSNFWNLLRFKDILTTQSTYKPCGLITRNGLSATKKGCVLEATTPTITCMLRPGCVFLNKLVFSSIKAYNTTQIFHLVTETIEWYHRYYITGIGNEANYCVITRTVRVQSRLLLETILTYWTRLPHLHVQSWLWKASGRLFQVNIA